MAQIIVFDVYQGVRRNRSSFCRRRHLAHSHDCDPGDRPADFHDIPFAELCWTNRSHMAPCPPNTTHRGPNLDIENKTLTEPPIGPLNHILVPARFLGSPPTQPMVCGSQNFSEDGQWASHQFLRRGKILTGAPSRSRCHVRRVLGSFSSSSRWP